MVATGTGIRRRGRGSYLFELVEVVFLSDVVAVCYDHSGHEAVGVSDRIEMSEISS